MKTPNRLHRNRVVLFRILPRLEWEGVRPKNQPFAILCLCEECLFGREMPRRTRCREIELDVGLPYTKV